MAYNAGAVITTFKADMKSLSVGIKNGQREVEGFADSMKKTGQGMLSIGSNLSKYLTAPIALAGGAAAKLGMDFEDAMQQSISIMGDVSNEMQTEMEKAARAVALSTDKSAKEAAESYFYLASAGLSAAESIEALPRVAEFATAGQFDMAEATDLLTDAQSALGLAVDDTAQNMENMERVSDVLVKANTVANASVQQFSESLTNKAGAALRNMNKSVEEGVAVLAALADQGIKGARAGNELARVLNYLQKAQLENSAIWEDYNMSIYDAQGNMKNMADIIEMLEDRMYELSDAEKTAMLDALGFGAETQATMKTLMGTSEAVREYQNELEKAGGITAEVANNQMQSMKKQLGLIWKGIKDFGLSFYSIIEPALKNVAIPLLNRLVGILMKVGSFLEDLPEPVRTFIGVLVGLAAAVGPVLIVVGTLMTIIAPLIPMLGTIAGVISALALGPIALIIGAVVGAIAIWKLFGEEIKALIGILKGTILEDLRWWKDRFIEVFDIIKGAVSRVMDRINEFIIGGWTEIKTKTIAKWNKIKDFIGEVLSLIKTLFLNWTPTGLIIKYWDEIFSYTQEIWNKIKDFITGAWNRIVNVIKNSTIVQQIIGMYEKVRDNAVTIFENMKIKIINALNGIKDGIKNIWNNIKDTITDSKFWDATVGNIKDFVNNVKDNFAGLPGKLYDAWTGLKEGVKDFWTGILDDLKGKFQNIVDWIPNKIQVIIDNITQIWSDIKTFLEENDLYDIGRNIIVSLADGIRDALGQVIETIKDSVQNIYEAAKEKLGISSPSKVFMDIGGDVGEGLELGIENKKRSLKDKAEEISELLISNMKTPNAAIVNPAVNRSFQTINNNQNSINNNFQPKINMQIPENQNPADERRRQEQLLRKLGAEFKR